MSAKYLIVCGRTRRPTVPAEWASATQHNLQLGRGNEHIHLEVESIPKALSTTLTGPALDLAEIAAFVFAADQLCRRGGLREFEYGHKWRRHFRVEIPVREPSHWRSAAVRDTLQDTLTFLTDDDWEFDFKKNSAPAPATRYFHFVSNKGSSASLDGVQLFSGGLDSFGGAVREVLRSARRIALVSHVSTEKVGKPQRDLVEHLRRVAPPGTPSPLHIQVKLSKGKSLGREETQRSRSFVFAAFAAIVAHTCGLDRIRIFENGIVSFNLPTSMQVIGGRASRTTHPRSLELLSQFLSVALKSPMTIENPFIWRTKAEILQEIKTAGYAKLCKHTISCAHTMNRTLQHSHCGRCSQCVDRRFVMRAAGYDDAEEPPEMYSSSLTSALSDQRDVTTLERYIGTALGIRRLPDTTAFLAEFGEVARTLKSFGMPTGRVLEHVFELHKRHADQVVGAVQSFIQSESSAIAAREVPPLSPLGIAGALGRVPGEAKPLPAPAVEEDLAFRVDLGTFTVWNSGVPCPLGNTVEFRLICALAKRPGQYMTHESLMSSTWNGQVVQTGTVHKTASNLRRRLREAEITGVNIDGKNRGHLAITLPSSVSDVSSVR